MTMKSSWHTAAFAAFAATLISSAAFAQDAATTPAAGDTAPAAAEPSAPNDWIRLCGEDKGSKKEVCFVQRELRTEAGQFLASAGIREVKGESRRIILLQTPVGMLIQPGMRVQVDNGKQEAAKYTICFPNACFAELPIKDEFIASLKKGNNLILTTLNQQAKAVNFTLSLKGFTSAFDGPPLDTAALQRQQQQLQEELQRKAKEAQQKLLDAQKAANDTAPTTEPAPAQ